jgi:hypothetical protein
LLRKKPKKKKSQPFYTQGWFQGVGILAILLGIGTVLYFAFFSRPSPQSLLDQARPLMEGNDPDAQAEARKGPLQRFLDLYPDLQGPVAQKMNDWADLVDREQTERSLLTRLNKGININLDDDERLARRAVGQEEAGDLAAAHKTWSELEQFKADKQDREKRSWGLLARQRLDTLAKVKDEEDRLRGKLGQHPDDVKKAAEGAGKEEAMALQGLYAETQQDKAAARQRWEELKQLGEASANRRVWYLMAAKHVSDLSEKKAP